MSLELWTCELCDMTMPRKHRGSHINGTPHSHKVAVTRALAPLPEIPRPEELKPKWKCLICNSTMKTQYKKSHLGSKSHNKKLAAFCEAQNFWSCITCDIIMPLDKKAEHLAGNRHTASLNPKIYPKLEGLKAEQLPRAPEAHARPTKSCRTFTSKWEAVH